MGKRDNEQIKCKECNKLISSFSSKGYDIKGNLLCGNCWNELDDSERKVMTNIKSKEDYKLHKTRLKNELKASKDELDKSNEITEKTFSFSQDSVIYRYGPTALKILIWAVIIALLIFYVVPKYRFFNQLNADTNEMSRIYISQEVDKILESRWTPNGDEFRFCLYAEKYKDSYLINKVFEPKKETANTYYISAEDCPWDSIGFIQGHTAYGGICMLSDSSNSLLNFYATPGKMDVDTFLEQIFPLTGIICGKEKYVFFTKKDMTKSLSVLVVEDNSLNDVTAKNPCPGNRFCLGECKLPCQEGYKWSCTSNGAVCLPNSPGSNLINSNNPSASCPTGLICNGECKLPCQEGYKWSCTSSGAQCTPTSSEACSGGRFCLGQCWDPCVSGYKWSCTSNGVKCT